MMLACSGALGWVSWAGAAEEPASPEVDSTVWQARFEGWVETALVKDELDRAARNLPGFSQGRTLRVLNQLVVERLDALPEKPDLPSEVVAGVDVEEFQSPHLSPVLERYAHGHLEQALQKLEAPSFQDDADATYLRAQLLDEHTRQSHPRDRLYVINAYWHAFILTDEQQRKNRLRLRIGQIFLELLFIPESTEILHNLLQIRLSKSARTAVRISFAEATYFEKRADISIETILRLNPGEVSPQLRAWAIRRMADSLFQQKRYAEAVAAYRRIIRETHEQPTVDPLARLRLAAALMEQGEPEAAQPELRVAADAENASKSLKAVASLLLARALRDLEFLDTSLITSRELVRVSGRSRHAALAAVDALETARLAGQGDLEMPEGAARLLDSHPRNADFGLLAYRVASTPGGTVSEATHRRWLGELLKNLPKGAVWELTHDDLAHRLQKHLQEIYTRMARPDPRLLDDVERFLDPRLEGENALLIGLEAFAIAGRWETCIEWGRELYRRELRPIRRGLGTWRAVQCDRALDPELKATRHLMEESDARGSGPFALAFAGVLAEEDVRKNQLSEAIQIYERALESIAEPRLVGPVLLRLGELQLRVGTEKLGLRRLWRGLTLLKQVEVRQDPFRKVGVVALARLATSKHPGGSQQVKALLKQQRRRAGEWWSDAYAYLAFRSGIGPAPEGEGLFSQAAQRRVALDRLKARAEKLIAASKREAAKAEATGTTG